MPNTLVASNGDLIRLAPNGGEVIAQVRSGRLALDGRRLVPVESKLLKARNKMAFAGAALATVVLDAKGRLLADPKVTVQGLLEAEDDLGWAAEELRKAVEGLSKADRADDEKLREAVRIALRRALDRHTGKKPLADVHVVRL